MGVKSVSEGELYVLNVLIWHNYLHVLVFERRCGENVNLKSDSQTIFKHFGSKTSIQILFDNFCSATSCVQRKAAFFLYPSD